MTVTPRPKVLIVDDERDFAVSTARALALEGITCLIAHDSATALAQLTENPAMIALVDIRIRHEDGTQLAARLRAVRPELLVIIMTAYASIDSAVAAMHAGAHDYLSKPFFLDELMRALNRCFEVLALREDKARAEQDLAILRQLEATSRLATGLSHDFNNMLAVIQANVSVILDRLGPDHALAAYADDADRAARAAAELVARLMDFTRSGQSLPEPIDLREPVATACRMMQHTLCVDMRIALDLPDVPLLVPVAPTMLETAVVNLLINARDATEGRGRVIVTLSLLRQGGNYARLVVQDDGPGLSAEVEAMSLHPFFTTKPKGTGLGLPMIQQLALATGGAFRIGTAREGGARAVLDLPAITQPDGENM